MSRLPALGLQVATAARHRARVGRHSISSGGRRLHSTYKAASAPVRRRRHRAEGPPSMPLLLEIMFGLAGGRPAW